MGSFLIQSLCIFSIQKQFLSCHNEKQQYYGMETRLEQEPQLIVSIVRSGRSGPKLIQTGMMSQQTIFIS